MVAGQRIHHLQGDEMTKIIDIIQHRNQYSTQTMLVVDTKPRFEYERVGDFLVAEEGGFFNFFRYMRPHPGSRAFGGAKFDIQLVGGGLEKANGQWWDAIPSDYSELLCSVGVASVESLNQCYVFSSGKVDRQVIDDWLADNEPSNNYNKYDKHSKDYGKQTIVSRFDNVQQPKAAAE